MVRVLNKGNLIKIAVLGTVMMAYVFFSSGFSNESINIIDFFENTSYSNRGYLWNESILERYFPYIISMLFISSIYKLYEGNIYEMSVYLNTKTINIDLMKSYVFYMLSSFGMYIVVIFSIHGKYINSLQSFLMLLLRFFVPVIFLIGVGLFAMAYSKNIIISLVVVSTIVFTDIISSGAMLDYLCLTVSERHILSLEDFLMARTTTFSVGVVALVLGLKRAARY